MEILRASRWLGAALLGAVAAAGLMGASGAASIRVERLPTHIWSRETVRFRVSFTNQEALSGALFLQWEVVVSGAVLERGSAALPLSGEKTAEITFTAPAVRHPADGECRMAVSRGEETLATCRFAFTVFPRWDPKPLQRTLEGGDVGVADPSGALQNLLGQHLSPIPSLNTATAVRSLRGRVLVLGPGARSSPGLIESALEAAETGLTVLWCEPGDTTKRKAQFGLPEAHETKPGRRLVLAPKHDGLAGLRPQDLDSWREPTGPEYAMDPPEEGNFRGLLVDADAERYLLLEMFPGAGRIVLCQLPVATAFEAEPAAPMLFESLLRYALEEVPKFQPASLMAPPGSKLSLLLEKAGVALAPEPQTDSLFIVAADSQAVAYAQAHEPKLADKIRRHLEAGGKCLFMGAEPESAAWLEAAGLRGIAFEPPTKDFTLRVEEEPLSAGISPADLEAALQAVKDGPGFRYQVAQTEKGPPEGRRVAVSPGAVVKAPVGAGEAILCQLTLDQAPEERPAIRLVQVLLTNLGVRIERKNEQ
jgi:hypothetical protein